MKVLILHLVALATAITCSISSFGQVNLIHNPNFIAIEGMGDFGPCPKGPSQTEYWDKMPYWQLPKLNWFPACWISYVATADVFFSTYVSEGHSVNCLEGEYVVGSLTQSTETNGLYYIEEYFSGGDSEGGKYAALSQNRPKQCGYGSLIFDEEPQWVSMDNTTITYIEPTNQEVWVKCGLQFVAENSFDRVTFGNTMNGGDGADLGPTGRIDNVKLLYLGPGGFCPEIRHIENITYADEVIVYKASEKIIAGTDVGATYTTPGPVIVGGTSNVTYRAGEEIQLMDGFGVEAGATFHAYIHPCDCDQPTAATGPEVVICDGNPVELGYEGLSYLSYQWSSESQLAMTYIANTALANPTFTPPINGNGSVEYTLTVTNTCGQSVSKNLRVIFMNDPNETPIVVPSFVNDVFPVQMAIATSSFVESIVITAYDITETTVLDSWTLIAFEDFEPGGPLGWTIPGFHLACEGYVIKVVGKSMCSGIWSATSTYTVEPSANEADIIQLSDVYWLDGTPPHDAINLYHTGFLSYTLRVYTGNNGTLIHHVVDVPITSNPVTIWDGSTNQHGWNHVAGNAYLAILELESCDGSITPIAEFWTILGGTGPSISGKLADPELEEEIGEVNATFPLILYPNPTTGLLTLTHSQQLLTVEVYDPLGRQLQLSTPNTTTTSIDLSGQPAGIYIIRAGLEDGGTETHRVVLSPP